MSELINLNGTTPAPASGFQLAQWQRMSTPSGTDPTTGNPYFDTSAEVPSTGGASVQTANYTLQSSDCGKLIVANSASAITFTLPATIPFAQWQAEIANIGTGTLSVLPGGSLDLDGSTAAVTVRQFGSLSVATDGSNYFSARGAQTAPTIVSIAGLTVDGGGSTPATGTKGFVQVPFAGTIIGWAIVADQAGSASFDIWKVASSAPPAAPSVPTSANKISASAPPALSSAQSASAGASGVSTWTTAVAQWDVLGFNLTAATTVTRITLQIFIQRS